MNTHTDNNIVDLLGMQSLPDEQKLAFVDRISTVVQKRLVARIYESLSNADQKRFIEAIESSDDQAMPDFFSRYVPNFEDFYREEMEGVKKDLAKWAESFPDK